MLTRVVLAVLVVFGATIPVLAEEAKIVALGLADHAVTEEELGKGATLPAPRFNSPGVAYVLAAGLKKGDKVEISLSLDGKSLMHNIEELSEDKATSLLQAGKRGVPAGGWPAGNYSADVTITRDGKTLLEQKSTPIPFE